MINPNKGNRTCSYCHRLRIAIFATLVFSFAFIIRAELSQVPDPVFWNSDGAVYRMSELNDVLYVGGAFGYVGPKTGGGALINVDADIISQPFPIIDGVVTAVASDGSGGWFFGGSFTRVAGLPRTNIVHVLANLQTSDTVFPVFANVQSMVVVGNDLVIGGAFTVNNGTESIANLAAVNVQTGEIKAWNPGVPYAVGALATYKGRVYAGASGGVAVMDSTSSPAQFLPPRFGVSYGSPQFTSMHVDGQRLYLGGKFRDIDRVPHGCAAAIDLETGAVMNWDPLPDSFSPYVYSILGSGETVYIGSTFLNAYDANTGELKWATDISQRRPEDTVSALAIAGSTLYVGGDFQGISGTPRRRLAALNATTGEAEPWTMHASSRVNALALVSGQLAAGGYFSSMGGVLRSNLAAFDLRTRSITDWKPSTDGSVVAVEARTNAIFVGGTFTKANNENRYCLAALAVDNGETMEFDAKIAPSWHPHFIPVTTLTPYKNRIIVGGNFTNSFDASQKYLTAIDADSLLFDSSWRPEVNDGVTETVVRGNLLYIAGYFTSVSGLPLTNLAAINIDTALASSWNPRIDGFASGEPVVSGMSILNSTMYVWGQIQTAGGQAHPKVVALNLADGTPIDWTIPLPGIASISKIIPIERSLFISKMDESGNFSLAEYGPETAQRKQWASELHAPVYQALEGGHALITGTTAGLAIYPADPSLSIQNSSTQSVVSIDTYPGQTFRIDSSEDLLTWNVVMTGDSNVREFKPPESLLGKRFYRVIPLQNR